MPEARRLSLAALLLAPAGLLLYFAFNSGGFYPGPQAYVAMLLCVVLALRATLADNPFAGFSRSLGIAVSCLALYTLWTLLSGAWSHAPGVARLEFDLPLLYLSAMCLFGSIPRTRVRLRWVLRALAAASVIVCASGVITRVLPHVWPIKPELANNRLSFPVTYWNVLGILAAIGIVLCLHLSSDLEEPRISRIAGATAIPVVACTLYFTFSRAPLATCLITVIAYLLIGRPRGMVSALLASGPTTAIAIKFAYDANLLATPTPTTSQAVAQGKHVAIALLLCVLLTAGLRTVLTVVLDDRLKRMVFPHDLRRRAVLTGWITIVVAALIAIVAFNGTIAAQYRRFVRPGGVGSGQDFRTRLTDPGNDGRIDVWRVAWREFKSAPLVGNGAGTYQYQWARLRPPYEIQALDAHSLYLETLDELGIVGFVLLLAVILTVLVTVARRARGSGRALYGATFAVLLAWAIHAGVDWDWEMPVVTIIFFSLGGFALAQRKPRFRHAGASKRRHPGRRTSWVVRGAAAAGFLLLALLPAYTWLSQRKLDAAHYAFSQGDCNSARSDALASISILGNRAEPYEVLSYCDLRLGLTQGALASMDKAVSLAPNDWNYRYGQALMLAAAGLDPRAAARDTLALNPHDSDVQQEWRLLSSGTPAKWKPEAIATADSLDSL